MVQHQNVDLIICIVILASNENMVSTDQLPQILILNKGMCTSTCGLIIVKLLFYRFKSLQNSIS